MQTENVPITGKETYTKKDRPYEALVEFYDAFNHRNLELMSNNWANHQDIAMDNPLGGIMRGWENIKGVYDSIFNGQATVYVEFYDYSLHEVNDSFYTVGRERGFFESKGKRIELEIRTSRIFRKFNGEWRQVHHHGSIEDPILLEAYQKLVRK